MKKLIVLLLLTGCTPVFLTDVDLVNPPATEDGKAKYKEDYEACKREITPTAGEMASSLMGPIGVVTAMAGEGKVSDSFKSSYTLRDECLKKKGYLIRG